MEGSLENHILSLASPIDSGRIPPITEIARALGLSRNEVLRAAQRLRDRGAVEFSRGRPLRRIELKGGGRQPRRRVPADEMLYHDLRKSILFGDFRKSGQLPKVAALARERQVSDHTVRAAYHRLVEDGLVYRTGKAFYAGFSTSTARLSVPRGLPSEILIFHPRKDYWAGMMQSERTQGFTSVFTDEADRFGIQLTPAFADPVVPKSLLCSGRLEIGRYIRSLGRRYLGTLIIGESYDYHRPPGTTNLLLEFLPWLCGFDRPVVWFDSIDNLEANTVHPIFKESYQSLLTLPEVSRYFARLYFDERSAVRKAVDILWGYGHRKFGSVNWIPSYRKWVTARIGEMEKALAECSGRSGYRLKFHNAEELQWRQPGLKNEDEITSRLSHLFEVWQAQEGVTAFVAPNDALARLYYPALRLTNCRIPNDISIISFDNNAARLYPWPVSSIDLGFQYLGFKALHQFTQDLSPGLSGMEIPSQSRINHLGSIGPAPIRKPTNALGDGHLR